MKTASYTERSSRTEVFCKEGFLKNFQSSQENTCAGVSFTEVYY